MTSIKTQNNILVGTKITYLNILSNFAYNSIILTNFTLNYYWIRTKKVHFLHHFFRT